MNVLRDELAVQQGAIQISYWWASADEFIQMLTTATDEEKFLEMAPSLAQAEEKVFREAIAELTERLSAPSERTRMRSLVTIHFMQQAVPDRMKEDAPHLVSELIHRLDDESSSVVGEAIGTLKSFGPDARAAIAPLTARMSDDNDWYAPAAAVAIGAIDPSVDVGPRLVELVQTKHPNWYQAAFHLSRHVNPEMARRVVTKVHEEATDDTERGMAIQVLNQIPAQHPPADSAPL